MTKFVTISPRVALPIAGCESDDLRSRNKLCTHATTLEVCTDLQVHRASVSETCNTTTARVSWTDETMCSETDDDASSGGQC